MTPYLHLTSDFLIDSIQEDMTQLTTRVQTLETNQRTNESNHDSMKLLVETLLEDVNDLKEFKTKQMQKATEAENKAVMSDFHNKKYNSILYNWPESIAWESPVDSRKELNTF